MTEKLKSYSHQRTKFFRYHSCNGGLPSIKLPKLKNMDLECKDKAKLGSKLSVMEELLEHEDENTLEE